MSKNPPDWWARILGGLGFLIALGGLALSYFNYRWERQKYAESQEEKIFVQLSAAYDFSPNTESPQRQLAVEVVNFGQQPMYLRSITGEVAGHQVSFYEHDPLNAKEPTRRLEPGEAADYITDWQWSLEDAGRGMAGTVEVETTKKRFPPRPARVNGVMVSGRVSAELVERLPLRKNLLPPPLIPRHK